MVSATGEELRSTVDYRMSDLCVRDGITWDWFPENWSFGNGVTVRKTTAIPEYRTVVHGSGFTLGQFLMMNGPTRMAELALQRQHNRTEGWDEWEARWLPGTCPGEAVNIHLTWLVFQNKLPEFAYQRLRESIESPGYVLPCQREYERQDEPGKFISETRRLTLEGKQPALPVF